MSALIYERVHDNLNRLKLTTFEALLDNYLEIAAKDSRLKIRPIFSSPVPFVPES